MSIWHCLLNFCSLLRNSDFEFDFGVFLVEALPDGICRHVLYGLTRLDFNFWMIWISFDPNSVICITVWYSKFCQIDTCDTGFFLGISRQNFAATPDMATWFYVQISGQTEFGCSKSHLLSKTRLTGLIFGNFTIGILFDGIYCYKIVDMSHMLWLDRVSSFIWFEAHLSPVWCFVSPSDTRNWAKQTFTVWHMGISVEFWDETWRASLIC